VIGTTNYAGHFFSNFNGGNQKVSMYPNFYFDTYEFYNSPYYNRENQEFGNFFEKVTSKKFIGEEPHFGQIRKIYLVNEKEYDLSYKGIYREPLLIKNKIFKEVYSVNNQLVDRLPLKQEIYTYQRDN